MYVTNIPANYCLSEIENLYNSLKNFINDNKLKSLDNFEERVISLENSRSLISFDNFFKKDSFEYIADLRDKILHIKNKSYDSKILLNDLKDKINKLGSLKIKNYL